MSAYARFWKDHCGWCGSKDNELLFMKSVPERYGLYTFCKNTECIKQYDRYVYRRDLTHGMPYDCRSDTDLELSDVCNYCGNADGNLVRVYKDDTFCKNAVCYRTYLEDRRRNSQAKVEEELRAKGWHGWFDG